MFSLIVFGCGVLRSLADATAEAPQEFAVSQTFDDTTFRYRMKLLSRTAGYRIYRLTYPSPVVSPVEQNNTVPADFYLPEGIEANDPKRPAVICMHILEGNFELVHMTCSLLASRGIPAIMFKLPYYGERSLPGGRRALASDPQLFADALSQAFQDVRRTIDVLASRPEIDADRIGITGISLGGIVAATAAGAEPRLARAALILGGGDLIEIVHHARETKALSQTIERLPPEQKARLKRSLEAVDPLRHAAGLRDRARRGKVLMINAAEDEVIPRRCTEKLAAALGMTEKVIWLEGLGHYTAMAALPQSLQATADFFARDLPPQIKAKPPLAPAGGPLHMLASLMRQVGSMLASEPSPGRCHFIDLDVSVTLKDGKEFDGQLRFIRGAKQKFSLQCKLPIVGEAAFGQGDYPWMASGEKIVFKGTADANTPLPNPLAFADPQNVLRIRMLSGVLAAAAVAPEMLERWITLEDDSAAVRIARKDRKEDHLRIVFGDDRKTPRKLTFDVEGVRGTVTFRAWQFDTVAHDTLFKEPAELPTQEVDPVDLARMFSAMFNFALENVR